MALNDITFVKGRGGLGRALPGEDYISGFVAYTGSLPSGFTSSDRMHQVFSVEDAEDLGIVDDFSDETQATGSYLVTAVGADGDTIAFTVAEWDETVDIGTYEKVTADTTVANVATGIAAAINAGTSTHGYSATVNSATVTITAREGTGIFLNSGTPLVATITGTIAGTLTQFSGGVASLLANYHYHISEYFRIQPQGNLWVGLFAVPTTYDFAEVQEMQNYSGGKIRQFGVFIPEVTFATAKITALQTIIDTIDSEHKPCSALIAMDMKSLTLAQFSDLSGLDSEKVSHVSGQDGANEGYALFKGFGKSISCLGAALGAVSLAKVSEDIAWVSKFNLVDSDELDVVAFANGTLWTNSTVTTSLLTTLNNYRHIFLRKITGVTGTYFNDSHTCTLASSDYANIENNRAIDKAVRGIRTTLAPDLNSPLKLNSDGTLTDGTIAYFESQTGLPLEQMVRDGELSDFSVVIDPDQDVATTSTVIVAVTLVPIGVARNITVNIGFGLTA